MARFVRQTTIWSELERELPPGLEEVREFLDIVSEFDEGLVQELERQRSRIGENGAREKPGKGRDDLPVRAMWNLLATSLFLRNGRQSETLAELRRNGDLARLLGFTEIGPNQYRLPSPKALSRFHVKLQGASREGEQDNGLTRALFDETVEALAAEDPNFGSNSALDSSDTRTHARPRRVKKSELTKEELQKYGIDQQETNDPIGDEGESAGADRVTVSSDNEASWSIKQKVVENKDGKKVEATKRTFGYKTFYDVDVDVGGVISAGVETGSYSDQKAAVPMVRDGQDRLPEGRRKTVSMEKGFDSEENVRALWDMGIAAIVPVRDVPQNLDSLPKEDREVPLSPASNVVYDKYTGEVACYGAAESPGGKPTRRTMTYAGAEPDRSAHKFRCPLGPRAKDACPFFQACTAGPAGTQGPQVRVPFETDFRRFAPVYPRSKRWRRLYNGRSAVERAFSYAKEVLPLQRHALRGKKAIELRVLLSAITINIRVLAALRRPKALATNAA